MSVDGLQRRLPALRGAKAQSLLARGKARVRALGKRFFGVQADPIYSDMGEDFHRQYLRVSPYTMTSIERLFALREAVRYVSGAQIPGDVVECGVWRGGSSMMSALTLLERGDKRRLWLYDTFEGMPPPDAEDVKWNGESAASLERRLKDTHGEDFKWDYASLDEVRANMATTGYPPELVRYVQGKVEETIPGAIPDEIALLRLDTDWYASTMHELEHLWDRLSPGGVLILDDYGHWQGARQATDEFFEKRGYDPLLHRIDYTGRALVKRG